MLSLVSRLPSPSNLGSPPAPGESISHDANFFLPQSLFPLRCVAAAHTRTSFRVGYLRIRCERLLGDGLSARHHITSRSGRTAAKSFHSPSLSISTLTAALEHVSLCLAYRSCLWLAWFPYTQLLWRVDLSIWNVLPGRGNIPDSVPRPHDLRAWLPSAPVVPGRRVLPRGEQPDGAGEPQWWRSSPRAPPPYGLVYSFAISTACLCCRKAPQCPS